MYVQSTLYFPSCGATWWRANALMYDTAVAATTPVVSRGNSGFPRDFFSGIYRFFLQQAPSRSQSFASSRLVGITRVTGSLGRLAVVVRITETHLIQDETGSRPNKGQSPWGLSQGRAILRISCGVRGAGTYLSLTQAFRKGNRRTSNPPLCY